jgi:hypothetical protein
MNGCPEFGCCKNIIKKRKKSDRKKDNRKIETKDEILEDKHDNDFGHSKYIPIHVFETEKELTVEAEVGDVNIYDITYHQY